MIPGTSAHFPRNRVIEDIRDAAHQLLHGALGRFPIGFVQHLPGPTIPLVVIQGKKSTQPFHETSQFFLADSFHQEMDVIEHQTKSDYSKSHLPGQGTEQGVKHQAVLHPVE